MDHFPVVIIGAGPAGLAAAMQLTRQGQNVLVLERDRVGGLLWNANLVENYPGFPEGITGPDLVRLFQQQADRLQVKVVREEALETSYQAGEFRIDTNKRVLSASCLIAASGTVPRKLSNPAPGPELDDRVFCEVYPLLDCRNHTILIIGAGDAAFDYALNLAGQNQVVILNRGKEIKALRLLVERAINHPRIQYFQDKQVDELSLTEQGDVLVTAGKAKDQTRYTADYLITALGREPNTSFASRSIIKNMEELRNNERLFFIGDVGNGSHRQTAIAVGDGIQTAMTVADLLEKEIL
ncbi:MAG: NAD(P)/FAD-dependent oxidoreductase [Anaerolineales bacterium]